MEKIVKQSGIGNDLLLKVFLTMKLIVFIICFSSLSTLATDVYSQNARISLDLKNLSIKEVLKEIENSSEFYFLYNNELIDVERKVNIRVEKEPISNVIGTLFNDQRVDYSISGRQIILFPKDPDAVRSQQTHIRGKVTDAKGEALPGVSVILKGTRQGTITGIGGDFSFSQVPADAVLQFSFVGMKMQEIVVGNQTAINVVMEEETIGVDEVVVVGYGVQKKANLTGAVDQVTGKSLENRTMTNLTQGLQGVLPNLNIRLMDGKPIQAPSYNIRGKTSIGMGGDALVLIDGVEGDPSMLNPNDIESVSVLKDAASASIYGARGTFGVVLITTKDPEKGKIKIQVSSNYSVIAPTAVPELVSDGYTYMKMFSDAFVGGDNPNPLAVNKTMKFSWAYLEEFRRRVESGEPYNTVETDPTTGEYTYYGSTDWYHELYKKATSANEHNISVSGSSEKVAYMISGRMLDQNGIFRYSSDDYSIMNLRAKGTIEMFPWLTLDNNMEYSQMKYHNPVNVGENEPVWQNIADNSPVASPMFNPDGTLTYAGAWSVGDFWYGKNGIDFDKKVFGNTTGFTARFFHDKFRVKGDFTVRNTNNNTTTIKVPVPYSSYKGIISYLGASNSLIKNEYEQTQYIATNIYGEYENTFSDAHYIKIIGGYNYEQSTYSNLSVSRNNPLYADAVNIGLAQGQKIELRNPYNKWAVLGFFSRLNYSYKDRYLLEVNARYDGSSKFPSSQRYAFFPSVSGGWRITKEPFLHISPQFISNLKLRASYGSLGNGNIGAYQFQELLGISNSSVIINGILPQYTRSPNPMPDGLTWETSKTTNLGLDLALMSDRLSFVGDYYIRNTEDMYAIGLTLPALFGATSPKGNYADLETKGWEASISWRDQFNMASKPFNYNIKISVADNRSKITKYNNPNKVLSDYYEGQVIGEIWGFVTEGFFVDANDIAKHPKQSPQMKASPSNTWEPGDIKFKNLNTDDFINVGTNRISDPGDRKIIGNKEPRYTFGIGLGADWSNFFVSAFFQGVGKQDWYPSTESDLFWGQYNRPYDGIPQYQLGKIWTPENTDTYFPRYRSRAASNATTRELGVQTKYLQNVAYIRMKNIQIGYNLPRNLISRIGASNIKVYFSGENLWTYSPLYKLIGHHHLDVENIGPRDLLVRPGSTNADGANYPMMKRVTFGISMAF